jgi:hypothetical protein
MSAGMMRLHVYISMVKKTLAMDAYATKRETQRPLNSEHSAERSKEFGTKPHNGKPNTPPM